jgi:hypothetical protein
MERKYIFNERIDETLRQIYQGERAEGVIDLSRRLGWPYQVLTRRASQLGLSRPHHSRPWVKEEEELVRRNIHHGAKYVWKKLRQAGFRRSLVAVRRKITRAEMRLDNEFVSTIQVAQGFGVCDTTVRRWIARKMLRAQTREGAEVDKDHPYVIREEWLRRFIRENPSAFDIRKVDQVWFLSVVFQGMLGPDETGAKEKPLSVLEQERNEFGQDW